MDTHDDAAAAVLDLSYMRQRSAVSELVVAPGGAGAGAAAHHTCSGGRLLFVLLQSGLCPVYDVSGGILLLCWHVNMHSIEAVAISAGSMFACLCQCVEASGRSRGHMQVHERLVALDYHKQPQQNGTDFGREGGLLRAWMQSLLLSAESADCASSLAPGAHREGRHQRTNQQACCCWNVRHISHDDMWQQTPCTRAGCS